MSKAKKDSVTDEVKEEQELEEEKDPGEGEASKAPESEENVEQKQSDELKVIIIMKSDKIMLGVQSPDCDPVYTTLKGTLAAALKRVPKLVEEAKQKWSESPRYPKANLPEPAPSPTPAGTPAAPKPKKEQPSFF